MSRNPLVWSDEDGLGRMQHVYFRREFELSSSPTRAEIHLYAYTNYHLRVNGEMVGVGPARSYPELPEYDTYDISRQLGSGNNVIAVDVLHVGPASFHALPVRGGFTAWGEIAAAEGETIDVSTRSGWLCMPSMGHDRTTPKFSFAIPPIHSFDERAEPAGWDSHPRPEGDWQPPVELREQGEWGDLRPRSIPPLTNDEVVPKQLLGAYMHEDTEQILSFRVNQEYDDELHNPPSAVSFAHTYIHSPRKQEVLAGTYWGEHYLNGRPLEQQEQKAHQFARTDAVLTLDEGWNAFAVSYGMVNGIWEFHIAVPKSAGLSFSPEKELGRAPAFMTAGAFPKDRAESILDRFPAKKPESTQGLEDLWTRTESPNVPVSPAKGLAWCQFGESLRMDPHRSHDFEIPAGRNSSLVFDMGRQVLGRIFVEFDAPRGTVVDVGGDEMLRGERPNHFRNLLVNEGERHIARGGRSRLETFYPRSLRYLQVAVREHAEPVTIKRVGQVSQVYPYQKRGSFECSDPFFNTLWEYGWNTLRLCSEDVITDCPWRERTLYGGDLLPETATVCATTGDWRLPKRCIEVFLQSQSEKTGWLQSMAPMKRDREPLHDYPLLVLLNAAWYVRNTGDREFATRAEGAFRTMIARLLEARDSSGIVVNEAGAFIDWISITKGDRSCALNALSARALEAWAGILRFLGHDDEAARAEEAGAVISAEAVATFWDEQQGAFADSIKDGRLEDSHFIASSAWAMLFASTTQEQDERAVAHIEKKLVGFSGKDDKNFTSSYGAFYMLGALYEKGHARVAEDAIRQLYADMIYEPTGTIWEHFHTSGSLVHAWSTAPTYYLSTRALGVRLGFPDRTDLSRVLIAPQSETLAWAKGAVPHPLGLIEVDWRIDGGMLLLNYAAPEGVGVDVAPQGRLAGLQLFVNGERTKRP